MEQQSEMDSKGGGGGLLTTWMQVWNPIRPWFPKRVSFEDLLFLAGTRPRPRILLLNTLPLVDQDFLIPGTLSANLEEQTINGIVDRQQQSQWTIILYGRNSTDSTVEVRYQQLVGQLGFSKDRVCFYMGGLFEYALLQDVYGKEGIPAVNGNSRRGEDVLFRFKPGRTTMGGSF